ncbi:hypothetical protein ACIA8K_03845 [Catenuloplanes sp. NPDC051500]|uniref:hypothetical protein n=1 Tax=Catenuloplanes sp. NPDC051500 TaxID=3363959 RepID=UPI0037B5FD5E
MVAVDTDTVHHGSCVGIGTAAQPTQAFDMTVALSPVAVPLVNSPEFVTRR